MTITLDTPMQGPVDIAPDADPRFLGGAYDDATVAAFWQAVRKYTAVFGLRASILCAQVAKETAWFRFGGDVPADAFNLAGLGATGGGVAGLRYPDMDTGVCAVATHWMVYLHGDVRNWPPDVQRYVSLDQRYAAVLSTGHAGKIATLADVVNGVWAYSPQYPIGSLDNGYATSIVSIANTVTGGAPPMAEPTQADIGFPVEIDYAPFVGPKRALTEIAWWVTHDTEGGEIGSESVLKGPTASVHALIDRDGSLEYMVPIDTTAWTPGNDAVAVKSINVEKVGFAATGYTEAQYQSEAAFYRWCVWQGVTGIPAVYIGKVDKDGGPLPDIAGMLGHMDVPNPNVPGAWGGVAGHTDPGPLWDWPHFVALCTGAAPPPGVSPTYRRFDATGHGIDGGFRIYWEANGGLPIFGFPLTEEMTEQGRTVQYFQRAVFEYFPEFAGTPYAVQLRLLGTAAAKAAGLTGAGIS